MDRKSIIKFIDDMVLNIPLSPTEMDELYGIKNRKNIGFTHVRLVYHTALNHQMYPICPYCKNQITTIEDLYILRALIRYKEDMEAFEIDRKG